ncbi:MAG: hypothetical protein EOM05_10540 [Clostridia bacterium]|nr:hypothetical protein [Clostridia bacterium]
MWVPANVVVKIKLGDSNEYNYIGSNENYDIVFDGTFTYLISENESLSTAFVLPALTDFYRFGKCATNFVDSDGSTILSTATSVSITNNKLESELDSKGRYVYILSLNWVTAECYIKDYYGVGTNIHYFFTEFNKAITFVSTDINSKTAHNYEIIILPKSSNIVLSTGVTISSAINLIISLDETVTTNVTFVKKSTFVGNYLFDISNGSLTFGENSKATLVINGSSTFAKSLIKLTNATLTIHSGVTIQNCRNTLDGLGGVIYATGSTVNLIGARFENNSVLSTSQIDVFGGVVYAVNSTVNITSGVFLSNSISGTQNAFGGAVAVVGGSLNVTGGYFKSNIASSSSSASFGGAMSAQDCTIIFENALNDIIFEENLAVNGGAIFITECEDASINNLSIVNNDATNGGGIYISSSSALLQNFSFTYNYAMFGGGIYSADESIVEVASSTFANNSATQGAGIYLNNATFTITSSEFNLNSVLSNGANDGNGGAICAVSTSSLSVLASTFTKNSAMNGGAIYLGGNSVISTNKVGDTLTVFEENTATQSGGGIYFASESTTSSISNTLFFKNASKNSNTSVITNGGAIFFECGTISLNSVLAYGNTATNGGAFYVYEAVVNATLVNTSYSYTEIYEGTVVNAETGEEEPYTEEVEVSYLGDNVASLGGAFFIHFGGVLSLISGNITSNYASISGGAIYNNGHVTINTPNFTLNTSKDSSAIVNAGTFDFSGLATFGIIQNIYIEKKDDTSYYSITVKIDNYTNGGNAVTLSFNTEDYLLNVPVVTFINSTYFENYKAGNQVFAVENEDVFIITPSKTQSALVLLHQKYNLSYLLGMGNCCYG